LGYYTGKGLARKWPEPLGWMVTEEGTGQRTETSCEGYRLTWRTTGRCVKEMG